MNDEVEVTRPDDQVVVDDGVLRVEWLRPEQEIETTWEETGDAEVVEIGLATRVVARRR